MTDTRSDSEAAYRRRTEFDTVAWGSHCVDCYPGSCPYHVYVRDGKIIREEVATPHEGEWGRADIPDNFPLGCNKGAAWSQQIDSEDRLRYPMRRVGERGSGQWERISWDEAADAIADVLIDTIENHGPESILKEGTPEAAAIAPTDRFLGLFGSTITDLNGSINDFAPGHHLTLGKFFPIFGFDEGEHFTSDVILFWHTNPVYTTIPIYHWFAEARYHGAEIILFSPDVSPSHTHVDYHVPVTWGTDPAFALAMCQVIVAEGLVDDWFVKTQTDLSLLVRDDTQQFLRAADLPEGGRDDQFFHLDEATGEVHKASRSTLHAAYDPALAGEATVQLADGSSVTVRPLMVRMTEMLAEYTPEATQATTGVNPDTLRMVARKIAGGRTRIIMGMGANKAYHSDLYQRTMLLLLGLTGNWGRVGAGINCWAATQVDGQVLLSAKPTAGVEGAEQVLSALDAVADEVREMDPTMSEELVSLEMWRGFGSQGVGGMVPPVFFWYWHAGFKDRWNNPTFNDPAMARTFDEYFNEALAEGWWAGVAKPAPDQPPKVLIECGGNILRRTRGGRGMLLEHLWPKLDLIVTIDWHWSTTALHSDIVLPAAQHYEKPTMHIPILAMVFSDKAAEPIGEALPEWELFIRLAEAVERRAAARGLTTYTHRDGLPRSYADLVSRYTLNGAINTADQMLDEMLRDSAYAGVLPEGTTLETAREEGVIRFTDWGRLGMAKGQAAQWPKERGEPVNVFSNHVELGEPYPTLTRRAQFLIEHPWFVEAGEDLPVHKDPPAMGGHHPFRMTTGHCRWSIHAMNMANPVLIQTHRGEPHAVIHPDDAAARGIADNDPVRVFNDVGSFVVNAKLSAAQRPGGVTVYNGWAPHMFKDWVGPNDVEPGLVKYLGLAGGYGHLRYGPMEWQPVPIDRAINVDIERA